MQHKLCAVAVAFVPMVATAECRAIDDKTERLACYDRLHGTRSSPPATLAPIELKPATAESDPPPEKSWWLDQIHLRESLDLGSDGAAVAIRRSGGETDYRLSAAVIFTPGNRLLPQSLQDSGWAWQFGAGVQRDTSADDPVSARALEFGAKGTFFGSSPVILLSKIAANAKWNKVDDERAIGIRFSSDVLFREPVLDFGLPYDKEGWARFVFPHFGLHADRVRSGSDRSNLVGGHYGIRAAVYPGGAFWPWRLFGTATRAHDFGGPRDKRRSSTLYTLGVEYAFIDPDIPRSSVIPTLSLQRTIGSDFLNGVAKQSVTQLLLTLKVN